MNRDREPGGGFAAWHTFLCSSHEHTTHHHLTKKGGLITASTLALLGLVVLPYRRRAQRADFRRRVGELRTQMDQALAVRCVYVRVGGKVVG